MEILELEEKSSLLRYCYPQILSGFLLFVIFFFCSLWFLEQLLLVETLAKIS